MYLCSTGLAYRMWLVDRRTVPLLPLATCDSTEYSVIDGNAS